MSIQQLAVFCGAKMGVSPDYTEATQAFADAVCEKALTTVFGGGHVGLMGVLADRVLGNQGEIVGVIPQKLLDIELAHTGVADMRVVASMHERKLKMAELSDACVMLPGGVGSLDEFFEMFTLDQLGYQNMPCGILNSFGYYDGLIQFLDHAVAEGFLSSTCREKIVVSDQPGVLLDRLFAASKAIM